MNPLPPLIAIPPLPDAMSLAEALGPVGCWLLVMPIVSLVAVLVSLWLEDRERARPSMRPDGTAKIIDSTPSDGAARRRSDAA